MLAFFPTINPFGNNYIVYLSLLGCLGVHTVHQPHVYASFLSPSPP